MAQPRTKTDTKTPAKSDALPGVPKGPLTPEQQLQAIARAQSQAEQRIKLGLQLFKAAEAHTDNQQNLLAQVKQEHQKLREAVNDDVAKSLHAYDQWVAKIDEDFTDSLQKLEQRIDGLQSQWHETQKKIETMMRRSETMLDQSRVMIEKTAATPAQVGTPEKPPGPIAQTKPVTADSIEQIEHTDTTDRLYRDILARMNDGRIESAEKEESPPPPQQRAG